MESREEEPVHAGRTLVRPVSPEHPDCLLTIGSQRFTARLADERDSGLYVLIRETPCSGSKTPVYCKHRKVKSRFAFARSFAWKRRKTNSLPA